MIIVACLIVAVLVAGLISFVVNDEDTGCVFIPGTLIFGVFCGIILGFAVLPSQAPVQCNVTSKAALIALHQPLDQVSGNFFLGSGDLNSTPTYFYYEQHSGGAITGETTDIDMAEVFQDSKKNPYVETFTGKYKGQWAFWIPQDPPQTACKVQFHIPPGSIESNYHI